MPVVTTPTPAAGPESTDVPPTSTAATDGTSPGAEQSDGAEVAAGLAGEPSWSEILDGLSASEQSCIRGVLDEAGLDEAGLESAMSRRLFSDDFPMAEDIAMFACLAADTANNIFVTSVVAVIESEIGADVSDSEKACLGDWTADIDLASLIMSMTSESPDDTLALALLGGLAACIPDVLISLLLADTGVGFDELDENERTCLRELLADVDWPVLGGSEEDAEAAFTAVFGLSFGMFGCVPALMEDGAAQSNAAFSTDGATPAAVGEPIEGDLDFAGDIDPFVFEAVGGEFYEIDVSPGTLRDPTLALYGADGSWLDSNDDSGGSLAPLLFWEASGTGPLYVEVGGYDAGSYTLTIAVSDLDDDHADLLSGATAAELDMPVLARLEYRDDLDFFVFEVAEDECYWISVDPDTLDELPTLTLYGSDGSWLGSGEDSGDGWVFLYWMAPSAGPLYVEVGGDGTGYYHLTISPDDPSYGSC